MNQTTPENPRLKILRISDFMNYLLVNGWRRIDHPNEWIFVFEGPLDDAGKPIKLVLPRNKDFKDALLRLSEAINLLSALQEITPEDLLDKIMVTGQAVNQKDAQNIDSISRLVSAWRLLFAVLVVGFVAVLSYEQSRLRLMQLVSNLWESNNGGFIKTVNVRDELTLPKWKTIVVNARDKNNKEVKIAMGVLWDPYRWVLGSTSQVTVDDRVDGKGGKYDVRQVVETMDNSEARAIIAVGVASHENAKENLEKEEARAKARTDILADACQAHFIEKMPNIYSLNLGAFNPDKNPSQFSASERRVILLVVIKGEDSADLTSGVKDALAKAGKDPTFVFDARDYSIFNTDRFQVSRRR